MQLNNTCNYWLSSGQAVSGMLLNGNMGGNNDISICDYTPEGVTI